MVEIRALNLICFYTMLIKYFLANFCLFSRTTPAHITCVTEIAIPNSSTCLLAVGMEISHCAGLIALYSVQGSRVLRCIEIIEKVSSCCFINAATCERSDLTVFDGCLAVGTSTGKVILLDLALTECKDILYGKKKFKYLNDLEIIPCLIVIADVSYDEIKRQQKIAHLDNINFGIQLEGKVVVLLSIDVF